jgi:hypothetical protein
MSPENVRIINTMLEDDDSPLSVGAQFELLLGFIRDCDVEDLIKDIAAEQRSARVRYGYDTEDDKDED